MSITGAVSGAVAGAVVGGVVGAAAGAVAGGLLFSVLSPKGAKQPVQRIGELAQQTAKEGEARPIIWGRCRPVSGNIMHMSAPRIVRREVKQGGGGKGGKKKQPKQFEERVFRTYAIRICEGPITGIIRVWRNNKLVYDARGNEWGTENNGVFQKLAKFYLGRWDQMPDPSLESLWGAGEVPAYRGTCYMVVADEDLTDLGGSAPQYIYEVERAEGTYLTSRPYAIEEQESLDTTGEIDGVRYRNVVAQAGTPIESIGTVSGIDGIRFRDVIIPAETDIEPLDTHAGIDAIYWKDGSSTREIEVGAESVDPNAAIDALKWRAALIRTDIESESIESSAGISGVNWYAP